MQTSSKRQQEGHCSSAQARQAAAAGAAAANGANSGAAAAGARFGSPLSAALLRTVGTHLDAMNNVAAQASSSDPREPELPWARDGGLSAITAAAQPPCWVGAVPASATLPSPTQVCPRSPRLPLRVQALRDPQGATV